MKPPLLALFTVLALTGCGSELPEDTPGPTVGKPALCEDRLESKMTPAYLREGGIASIGALDKALQIAKTCREVPSNFPLDDAAYLARSEIVDSLR